MGWVVNVTLWPLYPQEWPRAHFTGWWVGPTAGLAGEEIPPTGFDPRTVQPVASRYTDYSTVIILLNYLGPGHKIS